MPPIRFDFTNNYTCRWLLCLWIFTIPTNLFLKILPNYGFVHGLQIDYLIPKLYLSDIVALLFVICVIKKLLTRKNWITTLRNVWDSLHHNFQFFSGVVILTTLITLFFVRQFFTPFPIASVWFITTTLLHIITTRCAIGVLKKIDGVKMRPVFFALMCTILLQSSVGLFQFWTQQSVYGYRFLGEPDFRFSQLLAKGDFAYMDAKLHTLFGYRVLPYGTTAHPNILAGFLVIGLCSLWLLHCTRSIGNRILLIVITFIALLCSALSLSVSAYITVVCALCSLVVFLHNRKKQISFWPTVLTLMAIIFFVGLPMSLPFLGSWSQHASTSIERRVLLNTTAVHMFMKQPVFGTGTNQWTAVQEQFSSSSESVRFVQPAHHAGLLILAENGLLGVCIVGILILLGGLRSHKSAFTAGYVFFTLVPLLSTDHFLVTLHTGQWLVSLTVIIFSISAGDSTKN